MVSIDLLCIVNLVLEYIKYHWKAKGRHGTHSPFIYKMVDECFRVPIKDKDELAIKHLIYQLKSTKESIHVQDFGAGSKNLKAERKISSILKISSSKGKYAQLFYKLAAFYKPKRILEFGTSLGIGTIHFAKGNPNTMVTTVEACAQTSKVAKNNFDNLGVKNVQLFNKTFNEFIEKEQLSIYDLIFIDGHHDGDALLNYLDQLEPYIHADTFVILDDIRWSDSMFTAWEKLQKDKRFNVSIDLFRMGILLKRPGQRKEHFVVKL